MIPDWVKQLPPERHAAQLIMEQQRAFHEMMRQQELQSRPSPYLNAHHMQLYWPRDIYIAGQVFDGMTGRKKP